MDLFADFQEGAMSILEEMVPVVLKAHRTPADESKFASLLKTFTDPKARQICGCITADEMRYGEELINICVKPEDQAAHTLIQHMSSLVSRCDQLRRAFALAKKLSPAELEEEFNRVAADRRDQGRGTERRDASNGGPADSATERLYKMQNLLRATEISRALGADALTNLSAQRETLTKTQGELKDGNSNLKDSNLVLKRISSWLNQFKS